MTGVTKGHGISVIYEFDMVLDEETPVYATGLKPHQGKKITFRSEGPYVGKWIIYENDPSGKGSVIWEYTEWPKGAPPLVILGGEASEVTVTMPKGAHGVMWHPRWDAELPAKGHMTVEVDESSGNAERKEECDTI